MQQLPVIAAFDFDGTLSYRDTLLPFAAFVKGNFKMALDVAYELPILTSCLFKIDVRQSAKEALLARFFGGMPIQKLRQFGKQFARGPLPSKLRPEALKCLKWHQDQGHSCVLISANLDVYLEPWGELMGFQHIITSRLDAPNGIVNGKLIGRNVWGPEKAKRLLELLGPKNQYELYVYGDSRGDRDLLALADHSYFRRFIDEK